MPPTMTLQESLERAKRVEEEAMHCECGLQAECPTPKRCAWALLDEAMERCRDLVACLREERPLYAVDKPKYAEHLTRVLQHVRRAVPVLDIPAIIAALEAAMQPVPFAIQLSGHMDREAVDLLEQAFTDAEEQLSNHEQRCALFAPLIAYLEQLEGAE